MSTDEIPKKTRAPKTDEQKAKESQLRKAKTAFKNEYLKPFLEEEKKKLEKSEHTGLAERMIKRPEHCGKYAEFVTDFMKANGYPDYTSKSVGGNAVKFTSEVVKTDLKGGSKYKITDGEEVVELRKKKAASKEPNISLAVNAHIKPLVEAYRAEHPGGNYMKDQKIVRDKWNESDEGKKFREDWYKEHPKKASPSKASPAKESEVEPVKVIDLVVEKEEKTEKTFGRRTAKK